MQDINLYAKVCSPDVSMENELERNLPGLRIMLFDGGASVFFFLHIFISFNFSITSYCLHHGK